MGYRNKIAILSRERYAQIKDLTYGELVKWARGNIADLDDDSDYVPVYALAKELYCLGKYCDFDLKKFKTPIFSKVRTHNRINEDNELYIIGEEGLLHIIAHYHNKIAAYYESLLNPTEDGETPEMHVRSQLREWKNEYCKPYSTDMESPTIVSSWKYEYSIFELVRILKAIDQKKYLICMTGW